MNSILAKNLKRKSDCQWEIYQGKVLLPDENVGILRALYALICAYNHLSELQNEVTATSKTDNHISANICAFQIQKLFVMHCCQVTHLDLPPESTPPW